MQKEEFKQHAFSSSFPVAAVVVLHFVTVGVFTSIYFGLKHSKLPRIKSDDFSAGKAIGFLFIPFFNVYWWFVFWLRLSDRVNFQFRLRNLPPPINRDLVKGLLFTNLIGVVVWVIPVSSVSGLVVKIVVWLALVSLFAIPIGRIQSATNRLALGIRSEAQDVPVGA